MHVYYLVLFKNFKNVIYLAKLKHTSKEGFTYCLASDRGRAFRFEYPYTATKVIKDYCDKYDFDEKDFKIMKVTEDTWMPI